MKGLVDTVNQDTERVFMVGVQLKADNASIISL